MLLFQGKETSYFKVTLTATNATTFSSLTFSWKVDGIVQSERLKGYFAFDRNQLLDVQLLSGMERPSFLVQGTTSMNRTIANYVSLLNMTNSGPLRLGTDSFTGCFYGGEGIDMSSAVNRSLYKQTCPLDRGYPCPGKGKSNAIFSCNICYRLRFLISSCCI